MDKHMIKEYRAINRQHTKFIATTSDKGFGIAILIFGAFAGTFSIEIAMAEQGLTYEWWYYAAFMLIGMVKLQQCQSKVLEKNKNTNYFDKFLYVPFDVKTMFIVKILDMVRLSSFYAAIITLNGLVWRIESAFWGKFLFKQRMVTLDEMYYEFFNISFGQLIAPACVITIVTLICIGRIYYDYRKAVKEG